MKKILLEGLLYPFIAILFCLIFGIPFLYVGFQDIHILGYKDNNHITTIELNRHHFWGLIKNQYSLVRVIEASLGTSESRRADKGGLMVLKSNAFISNETQSVPILAGSSNTDEKKKRSIVNSLNSFIQNKNEIRFDEKLKIRNLFGWVGLPFSILGILGLLGWPSKILKCIKEKCS
ncbi:hypothetical protein BVX98_00435 [bacterium F11]|nr:hypothetical protein BVX98_00435 [bacterium F11]